MPFLELAALEGPEGQRPGVPLGFGNRRGVLHTLTLSTLDFTIPLHKGAGHNKQTMEDPGLTPKNRLPLYLLQELTYQRSHQTAEDPQSHSGEREPQPSTVTYSKISP